MHLWKWALCWAVVCAGGLWAAEGTTAETVVYRFLGGERVRVIVAPATGENVDQVISDDGYLSLSTGTMVNLKGKTVPAARALITKEFESHTTVKHPQIALLILELPPRKVYVAGEVRLPRAIVLSPGVPLTLLGVLQEVGGITDAGDPTRVNVVRSDGPGKPQTWTIDATKLAQPGSADLGLRLEPGDVVNVPRGETFFLSGAINRTGPVHRADLFLAPGEQPRVSRVLLGAGGLSPAANRKAIYVLRMKPDGARQVLPVDLEAAAAPGTPAGPEAKAAAAPEQSDPVLQDLDILVASPNAANPNAGVVLLGRVRSPGIFQVSGGLRLSRLLALGGGYTDFAKGSAVTVVRGQSKQVLKVDLDAVIKNGEVDKDLELQDGDIVYVAERMF